MSERESDELCYMSAVEMSQKFRSRQLSPVEVTNAVLAKIERDNPAINAFMTVVADDARKAAKQAEQELVSRPAEELGRLHGIPITIKDLTQTAGVRTTYGTPSKATNIPQVDDLIWARLKAAGPILIGKSATPPLGALCVTESLIHGRTNNPWDLGRTVGGSSGGAAAGLAMGFGPLAVGSDGGGSIRVPASFCGVVGLKPSVGRVPLTGECWVYETADAIGPMTRTVADNALMLSIMAGPDSRDPFSRPETGVNYLSYLEDSSVRGLRIALCPDLGRPPLESDVDLAVRRAAAFFADSLGASVDEVAMDMPDFDDYYLSYWAAFFAMMGEDALEDLGVYQPIVEWMEHGKTLPATAYLRTALLTRERVHEVFARVFDDHDVLISATTPVTAFEHPDIRYLGPTHVAGQAVALPAVDFARFTDPVSNAGYPGITIPCGFDPDGLPVGMQIIGRHGADGEVLRVAAAFEEAWPGSRPYPSIR